MTGTIHAETPEIAEGEGQTRLLSGFISGRSDQSERFATAPARTEVARASRRVRARVLRKEEFTGHFDFARLSVSPRSPADWRALAPGRHRARGHEER